MLSPECEPSDRIFKDQNLRQNSHVRLLLDLLLCHRLLARSSTQSRSFSTRFLTIYQQMIAKILSGLTALDRVRRLIWHFQIFFSRELCYIWHTLSQMVSYRFLDNSVLTNQEHVQQLSDQRPFFFCHIGFISYLKQMMDTLGTDPMDLDFLFTNHTLKYWLKINPIPKLLVKVR